MYKIALIICCMLCSSKIASAQEPDSIMIRGIYDEALANGESFKNLTYLCKNIGPRLSGSANAEKAVKWSKELMEGYGFDRVYLQEVMVPHWERGEPEEARIIDGDKEIEVKIAALGGTIATPAAGIQASLIEVQSIDELKQLGKNIIKGKIVFFNRAFDDRHIETMDAYGAAVDQRGSGPVEAAKLGAVGAIIRSMTHMIDEYPHTGSTRTDPNGINIPAAAISIKGADILSSLLKQRKNSNIQLFFKQNCQNYPDVKSYNVIGELRGNEIPDEVIVVGGHLDSWEISEGAHDDGAGVVQSIEVLRLFKQMKYRNKRTIRAVLFMNEENGNRGGMHYAAVAKDENMKHIAAIESDAGGFTPRGFSMDASQQVFNNILERWKPLFMPYLTDRLYQGESGVDIYPLKETVPGITLIGFRPDSQRYFDIHHSAKDVLESVNKRELELGASAIAALTYLIDQHGLSFDK